MENFVWIIQCVSGVLLVLLVLINPPKGDGMGLLSGASQMFTSQKSALSGVFKLTAVVAIIFFITSFITGFRIFGQF